MLHLCPPKSSSGEELSDCGDSDDRRSFYISECVYLVDHQLPPTKRLGVLAERLRLTGEIPSLALILLPSVSASGWEKCLNV